MFPVFLIFALAALLLALSGYWSDASFEGRARAPPRTLTARRVTRTAGLKDPDMV